MILNEDVPLLDPFTVAELPMRPVPPAMLWPAVNVMLAVVLRRHAGLLARIELPARAELLIDPDLLQANFRLC
ncbi:MAG: hypothetical protein V3R75_02415 [Alphaproteobacteria bacterium]